MSLKNIIALMLIVMALSTSFFAQAQPHPNLILTQSGVEKIRKSIF